MTKISTYYCLQLSTLLCEEEESEKEREKFREGIKHEMRKLHTHTLQFIL